VADLGVEQVTGAGAALGQGADLDDLRVDVAGVADPLKDRTCLVLTSLGDEPVRALVLEVHPEEHQNRRDRSQAEHQPPVLGGCQPVVD